MPPQTPRRGVARRVHGGPQTYRILKFVVSSFGLDSVSLTEGSSVLDGSLLRGMRVTSLIIRGGGGPIEWQVEGGFPVGYV